MSVVATTAAGTIAPRQPVTRYGDGVCLTWTFYSALGFARDASCFFKETRPEWARLTSPGAERNASLFIAADSVEGRIEGAPMFWIRPAELKKLRPFFAEVERRKWTRR
jgi:hypothetical protein